MINTLLEHKLASPIERLKQAREAAMEGPAQKKLKN